MKPAIAQPLAVALLVASAAAALDPSAPLSVLRVAGEETHSEVPRWPPFAPQHCPNTVVRQAINPRLASNCTGIKLPWVLCRHCQMRDHDENGNFQHNRDMYNLEAPQCQAALATYVRFNPCDKPRVEQVQTYARALKGLEPEWKRKMARKDIGEFMYNVCELCCDCIPIGLDRDKTLDQMYDTRKAVEANAAKLNVKLGVGENTLIRVYRGNCPVHYYYDTCRMWPNLRDIANPWMPLNHNLDNICEDHVYPWWFSDNFYRRNWLANRTVTIPSKRFVDFLIKINDVLGCRNKRVWKDCARLELAQKRV